MLERLKKLTVEEVWAELIELGYQNQYEGNWQVVDDTEEMTMTGRAVTAQFMPSRPDLENQIIEQGKKEGRACEQRRTVSWAVSTLVEGDVYVADAYNKEHLGTVVGSNLGNGVYARSKRGGIFYGHVRDMEGLREINGFNAWIKGSDPSYMRQTLLTTINAPVRIGNAIVLPGDAVLAKKDGVIFIPPHLVEHLVLTGERIPLGWPAFPVKAGNRSPVLMKFNTLKEIPGDFHFRITASIDIRGEKSPGTCWKW